VNGTAISTAVTPLRASASFGRTRIKTALRAALPPLLFGLRLWASVCLALYIAFWLQLDNAYWAGTSAAIVCQPRLGASLRKGWFRMIGTLLGAIAVVVLVASFPQHRGLFLCALALWGAACALTATILRNFASYAAALAGYTVAIIGGDLLGAVGGVSANEAFLLAITRATEICIGIVSAGIVLAGTDLGGARGRLATLIAELSSGIISGFAGMLAMTGPNLSDTTPVRRDFLRRVIALDPAIDQALGESSQLRYQSPVLQTAIDGLFAALAGWRAVANHLARISPERAHAEARVLEDSLPPELREAPEAIEPLSLTDPARLHRSCEAAVGHLLCLPVETLSLRLLADQTARALAGMADALSGLVLLVADPARSLSRGGSVQLRVPDWLPALVNAARAFVTIAAVALFWIASGWPNGAAVITFAAIEVILLAPRADQAFTAATEFALGTFIAAVFAAVIEFALLPAIHAEGFAALAGAIGLVLIPTGGLVARSSQPGIFVPMTANLVPLLAPANQMSYDAAQFYNQALAIVVGTGAGAVAFRLVPPLTSAFRSRRLLALTLRDLRRLAAGRRQRDWEGHIHARLAAMPEEATPLQRARLLAALSVGTEMERLRSLTDRLGLGADLAGALAAMARGDSMTAIVGLLELDQALADRAGVEPQTLHGRGDIVALTEVLAQHASYFDTGAAT
jgi:uncharacterized membrane protein YccC